MNLPRSSEPDEPDFAEEHSRPTYEDEPDDLPDADRGDESVPEGPASEGKPNPSKPL
jgi:hypothetical protein